MSVSILGLGAAVPANVITQEEGMQLNRKLCCTTEEQATWLPQIYKQVTRPSNKFVGEAEVGSLILIPEIPDIVSRRKRRLAREMKKPLPLNNLWLSFHDAEIRKIRNAFSTCKLRKIAEMHFTARFRLK